MEGERPTKAAKKRRKAKKATIYEVFEPAELARSHLTDADQEIRQADTPERFQLRGIPVCAPEEGELAEEAEWIYKYAFMMPPLMQRDSADWHKPRSAVNKIREALKLMREQQFEVIIMEKMLYFMHKSNF
jgi:transcription elongation factor SPT6